MTSRPVFLFSLFCILFPDGHDLSGPFGQRLGGISYASARKRSAPAERRGRTGFPHVAFAARHPAAAVRHERDHGFPAEIAARQKSQDRRSHRAPPVRRADEDHVILVELPNLFRQFRLNACSDLAFRLIDTGVVIGGIRFDRLDLKERAAGGLLNLFGRKPRIAAVRVIGDQNLSRFPLRFPRVRLLSRVAVSAENGSRHRQCH